MVETKSGSKAMKRFSKDDIDVVVNWVMDQIGPVGSKFQDTFDSFNFMKLMNLVMFLAGVIEMAARTFEGMTGPDKKEVLVRVINRLIDIPFVPENVEGWAIEMLIDQVIDWLNKIKGKKWGDQFKLKK